MNRQKGHIAAALGLFNCIHQVAPIYTQHMLPWTHSSPHPKRHLDCFSHSRQSLYFTMGHPSPPSKMPFCMGNLNPHVIQYMVPCAHPSAQSKRHLIQFSRFCSAGLTIVTVTSHPGQLSLLPSAVWEMSTSQSVAMLCACGLKAGMVHCTCG